MVNSLTVGGNRSNNINMSKASQMGTDWDQKLGIQRLQQRLSGVSVQWQYALAASDGRTQHGYRQRGRAVNDILHWQHGAHSFKLGGDAQYHQYSWVAAIGGTAAATPVYPVLG